MSFPKDIPCATAWFIANTHDESRSTPGIAGVKGTNNNRDNIERKEQQQWSIF